MSEPHAETADAQPPTPDAGQGSSSGWSAGRLIGQRYRLVALLGVGAMGEVWRAKHEDLNTEVAIKIATVGERDRDRIVERFRFEAQVSAQLARHTPHIVAVHDTGHNDGAPYMVMELVEGRSLQAIMNDGTLAVERVAEVLDQLADGLDAAHQRGIWHRDIKPANVLIAERADGRWMVKLADFGVSKSLARELDVDDPGTTESGALVGSPSYMSPEQLDGHAIDARSDLWSLAVLVYEVLSGSLPFEGRTLAHLITSITTKKPIPISVVTTVPRELDGWFDQALAKRADERFADARAMAQAFREAATRTPARRRPLRWAALVAAVAAVALLYAVSAPDAVGEPARATAMPTIDVALPTATADEHAPQDPTSAPESASAALAPKAPPTSSAASAQTAPTTAPPAASYDPSDTF